MKYNPALAYRAMSWQIVTFKSAKENADWCHEINLIGAICTMFKNRKEMQ